MKKLLFFLMILCVQNLNAQTQKTREDFDKRIHECPPGSCSFLYIDIEIHNFHTKRSGCEENFGFCGHLDLGFICQPCIGKSVIDNGKIFVYGRKNDQSIELHFTQEIQHEKEFENANFSDFELEDNMLSFMNSEGKSVFVPGGNYPVKKINNEFVVEIPIK